LYGLLVGVPSGSITDGYARKLRDVGEMRISPDWTTCDGETVDPKQALTRALETVGTGVAVGARVAVGSGVSVELAVAVVPQPPSMTNSAMIPMMPGRLPMYLSLSLSSSPVPTSCDG
jgi:hypothetical protein